MGDNNTVRNYAPYNIQKDKTDARLLIIDE